jgi:hypothetical protein
VVFKYRAAVIDALSRHGVSPGPETPPALVREFVNDLYLFEIRKLRDRMRAGSIPKDRYAALVAGLRDRYPVLSLPIHRWTVED